MKFLHLADLHFGKTLHNLSLIESGDQPYWVDQVISYIEKTCPDAVIIAGDVYDRGVPSKEAVLLLSRFLTAIVHKGIPVFIISGNHDGGERLEFAADLLEVSNVYIAGTVQKEMVHVTRDFRDGNGPVTFWLMPHIFPAAVRQALGRSEDEMSGYTQAARGLLEAQNIDYSQRNVLIAHQTVLSNGTEPEHSLSETAIGGVGGIDASVFDGFDYVALGHIHGAQTAGGAHVRYAGSPLCYHFSEARQKKGPLMVIMGSKGETLRFETADIPPLHRVRPTMTGKLEEIIRSETDSTARNEFVRVVLTDDWVSPDDHEKLRALFESHGCRLLDIQRISERNLKNQTDKDRAALRDTDMETLFRRFYRMQTGLHDPDEKECALIRYAAGQAENETVKSPEELADALVEYALKQEDDPS